MVGQWKWCVEKEDGTVAKGWYKDKENWYFLKDNGVMFTGWLQDKDGRWYYLNSNGIMQTGWLKEEIEAMAKQIKKDLDNKKVYLKQNEFDSLCSFAYNCGVAALFGSTLYKNIIVGIKDSATIISNFQAWSNAGGRRIEGLYKRRTKESAIFLKGDYVGNV